MVSDFFPLNTQWNICFLCQKTKQTILTLFFKKEVFYNFVCLNCTKKLFLELKKIKEDSKQLLKSLINQSLLHAKELLSEEIEIVKLNKNTDHSTHNYYTKGEAQIGEGATLCFCKDCKVTFISFS